MHDFLQKNVNELTSEEGCMRRFITSRPSWDKFAYGVWDYPMLAYDKNNVPLPSDKQPKRTRWKPSIHSVCERLLDEKISAEYALRIYQEAIDMLLIFGQKPDFFVLATYRQYLPIAEDIPLDRLFFACMRDFKTPLTGKEWRELWQRLPKGTSIALECIRKSHACDSPK